MIQELFAFINSFASKYLFWIEMPQITKTDIVEIIIISFLLYNILVWIKKTRAWNLLKGIIVVHFGLRDVPDEYHLVDRW